MARVALVTIAVLALLPVGRAPMVAAVPQSSLSPSLVFRSPAMYAVVPLAAGAPMQCVLEVSGCPDGLVCAAELTTLSSSAGAHRSGGALPAGLLTLSGVEHGTISLRAQLLTRPSSSLSGGDWTPQPVHARLLFDAVPMTIERFMMPAAGRRRALPLPPAGTPPPRLGGVSVCFVGSTQLDGIKVLFVQQSTYLARAGARVRYVSFDAGAGTGPVAAALARAAIPLTLIDLTVPRAALGGGDAEMEIINVERSIADAMVAANYSVAAVSRAWQRSVLERVAGGLEGCGVVVMSNGKNAGDDIIVGASRAIGVRAVVAELGNFGVETLDVSAMAALSHFVIEDAAVTVAAAAASGALRRRAPPSLTVITPGADLNIFRRRPEPRPWRVRGVAAIGFIGRLSPEKSPGLFVAAVAAVQREMPGALGVMIGDGPLRGDLEAMARELGARVRFVGMLATPAEVANELLECDVLVSTSLRSSETFQISNVEGMAVGVPLVNFGAAGLSEYTRHGETALVVGNPHPGALAKAILEVVTNETLSAALGAAAAAVAASEFSLEDAMLRHAIHYACLAKCTGIDDAPCAEACTHPAGSHPVGG